MSSNVTVMATLMYHNMSVNKLVMLYVCRYNRDLFENASGFILTLTINDHHSEHLKKCQE